MFFFSLCQCSDFLKKLRAGEPLGIKKGLFEMQNILLLKLTS